MEERRMGSEPFSKKTKIFSLPEKKSKNSGPEAY